MINVVLDNEAICAIYYDGSKTFVVSCVRERKKLSTNCEAEESWGLRRLKKDINQFNSIPRERSEALLKRCVNTSRDKNTLVEYIQEIIKMLRMPVLRKL